MMADGADGALQHSPPPRGIYVWACSNNNCKKITSMWVRK
jgi:hypothetical protein